MRPESSSKPTRGTSKTYRISTRPTPKTQHVEAPRPTSLHEPASVQDRIQRWQDQGAAEALAPDAVSVRSLPVSECASDGTRPRSPYDRELRFRTRGRKKNKEQDDPPEDRSKSTPRRRIISDGHWKARQNEKNTSATAIGNPTSESRRYDPSYTSNQGRHKTRRRSKPNVSPPPAPPLVPTRSFDDHDRIVPANIEDALQGQPPPYPYDLESRTDEELARHLTTESVTSGDFEGRSNASDRADDDVLGSRKLSRYAQSLARSANTDQGTAVPRPRRGGILGKTKDMFMKSEAVPTISNRIPSIEAWLYEQPDPFVENRGQEEMLPVEVPKPLRKRTPRKRSSGATSTVADPNQIWNAISPKDESRSPETTRKADSIYSLTDHRSSEPKRYSPRNTTQVETDGSPTGLRRRGARMHRQRDPPTLDIRASESSPASTQSPKQDLPTDLQWLEGASPSRRLCPPTGARPLSTIASVETFKAAAPEPEPQNPVHDNGSGLKRKLTTHDDLMSVLSMPRRSRNRRSARTARGSRAKQCSESTQEVLVGLTEDEQKYGRELQTLVDGVIPVLLQYALSKTDSTTAAALFMPSGTSSDGMGITKPIIEMGIALERLKTLHRRIPLDNVEALLNWAKTSEKAYQDYLQAWRLGFEDVVVDLAPIEQVHSSGNAESRDDEGAMCDGQGKKTDVAYLLKRPLVRVKALSRTLSQIRDQYDTPLAAKMAEVYTTLTALARKRNQEEQAKMEDRAAADVDATRIRDLRTMAATTQVSVNTTRRVKARDFFNLTIYHSSGQQLDCGVEMVFRDNAPGDPSGGDVLVCELDNSDKWLLFAPIEVSSISARRGENGFDLVVMVRGRAGMGKEWHELLALKTEDKDAVTEWMNMLGSNPLPPRLSHTPDVVPTPAPLAITATGELLATAKASDRTRGLNNLDIPIGEPSVLGARSEVKRRSRATAPSAHRTSPALSLGGGLASKPVPQYQVPSTSIPRKPVGSVVSSDRSTISDGSSRYSSTILTSLSSKTASTKGPSLTSQTRPSQDLQPSREPLIPQHVRETRNQFHGRNLPEPPIRDALSSGGRSSATGQLPRPPTKASAAPPPPVTDVHTLKSNNLASPEQKLKASAQRPVFNRAPSSTPSRDLPTVKKLRPQAGLTGPATEVPLLLPEEGLRSPQSPQSPRRQKSPVKSNIYTEDVPAPPAHTQRPDRPSHPGRATNSSPPAIPPHRTNILEPASANKGIPTSKHTSSPAVQSSKRRGSSPLKHEYAPSTSSSSSSDYDSGIESDSSSDTSEEFLSEHGDMPTPLVAINGGERRSSKPSAPPSMPPSSYQSTGKSIGTRSLAPSDSASQGPYRKVPTSNSASSGKTLRTIALICAWSDRGMWEQIHADECSVVISPGLIEAFEMSAAHSRPSKQSTDDAQSWTSSTSQQPLVAFELTPIVPLRRGTALDISIRSPPTPNSKIRSSNNIMFRSRNPEECGALYGMINWARCNNPTYNQLQAARPHRQPSVTFNVGQGQNDRAKSSSWFSFGRQEKSSYRASSAPTPASIDMSVESSGTVASAFSALRRFGGSNAFNLNRSSVLRKGGGAGTGESLYSSTSGTRTSSASGSSTPAPSQAGFTPGKDGPNVPSTSAAAAEGGGMVNNMKIRLYVRKGQHWENLGAARLSVLPASPTQSNQATPRQSGIQIPARTSPPPTPAHSRPPSTLLPSTGTSTAAATRAPRLPSSSHTPHRIHGNGREKRIVITHNKNSEHTLLDSVLGESSFERVMQTGIAVKVWSEDEVIQHTGGVLLGKEKLYMMQFKGAGEAGWVFGLCGVYRYGNGGGE